MFLIECGCTPPQLRQNEPSLQERHFLPVSVSSRRPCCHQRQRYSGFSPVVAPPEYSFHYQHPALLVDPGNDNPFGLAAINDFLRGFADIVRLGEFAIHQRTEFFLLGLTNSMLPIASAALNASPELSTMQRIPCFCAAEISWVNFSSFTLGQASAYDQDGPGFNFQNLLFKLAKLIFI